MKTYVKKNMPVLLLCLLTLVFAKLQYNKMGGSKSDACMGICSDGRGYYAWLPAIFIYQDVNFNFFEHVEVKDPLCGGKIEGCLQDYRSCTDGIPCNKYYPGTALMMLPFFTAAHYCTALFTDAAPNGYTHLYFVFIAISGVVFYLVGMLFFWQVLKKIGLSIPLQTVTILLVTLGTNILYFAVDKPSYSHIYSFTQIAVFLYLILLLKERFTIRRLLWLSWLVGLIFITRPVNVSVLLLLPFVFWEDIPGVLRSLFNKPTLSLGVLPVLIMPMILFGIYYKATGHFFVYSYGSEGFNFLHPNITSFLFHYNNGVLPYTPLLLMPFLLLFIWFKPEYIKWVLGAAVTLAVTIYIHSSWWCWWYGYSFGARSMLDFAPLFGLIIGLSLEAADKKRALLLPVYFACCVVTLLLYHQKNHGFMNGEVITDYWDALTGVFKM